MSALPTLVRPNGRPEILPTPASPDVARDPSVYRRLTWRTDADTAQEKVFDVAGDHLWIAELVGRRKLYASLNDGSNIPLREGMVITRRFGNVTLRTVDRTPLQTMGQTRITAYASWGPMVDNAEPTIGLDAGFLAGSGTATTAPASIFAGLVQAGQHPTPGKGGGVLKVKNTDLVADLFVAYGVSGAGPINAALFYPIRAGETENFPLRSLVHRPGDSIIVATTAGTCTFAFLCSPGSYDLSDMEQTSGVSIP